MDAPSILLVVCMLLLAGAFAMLIGLLQITLKIKERLEAWEPPKRPETNPPKV